MNFSISTLGDIQVSVLWPFVSWKEQYRCAILAGGFLGIFLGFSYIRSFLIAIRTSPIGALRGV
jgi:hypothetical protein